MQANSERRQANDETIQLRRIDGKLYREVSEVEDASRSADSMARSRRSPWKTAFISLVVLAAVVLLLSWMAQTSGNLHHIQQGVAQNGQALTSQQYKLSSLQDQVAHIQSQIAGLSSQMNAWFAKLFSMLSQQH